MLWRCLIDLNSLYRYRVRKDRDLASLRRFGILKIASLNLNGISANLVEMSYFWRDSKPIGNRFRNNKAVGQSVRK